MKILCGQRARGRDVVITEPGRWRIDGMRWGRNAMGGDDVSMLGGEYLLSAADELHAIGRALAAIGLPGAGNRLADAAADIDAVVPEPAGWWTSAFNGQAGRSRLFTAMLDATRPAVIVETGAFRGTTTAMLSEHFAGPVFSCELDRRWYRAATSRLAGRANVVLREMDSRGFLREVLAQAPPGPVFIYLDAHWFRDLPLREELAIILASGRAAAIMIDDFAVPGDEGYGFDDYGPDRRLVPDLLAGIDGTRTRLFFPTLPAAQETGPRRGCAVIGIDAVGASLAALPELRAHDWPAPEGHARAAEAPPPSDVSALHRLRNAVWTEAELVRQKARAETAERSGRDAEAARAAALAQAESAEAARAAAETALADALASAAQAEAARQRAAEQTDRIRASFLASTSWKVTAPLRQVARWLGREQRPDTD